MQGFVTTSGTVYYVNFNNYTICGGKFKYPTRFYQYSMMCGAPGQFLLAGGKVLRTSVIQRYF